jgi:uncharacterized surface protein with fasciclin (FAS1) repeats
MKKFIPALVLLCMMQNAIGQTNPQVGGATMYSSNDAVTNLTNSADHTVFITLINRSGLVNTIKGSGPFTIFAPTNAAFNKLPKGTIESWLKPENRATLVQLLSYHLLPGKIDNDALIKLINEGGGTAQLKTVAGSTLQLRRDGDKMILTDGMGNTSVITIKNVYQSNGVVQVVDAVLRPAQ